MNHFELRLDPKNYVRWPDGGGGFQPIDIYIDGRFLVDIIREVETPFFAAEDSDTGGFVAGGYLSLSRLDSYLPSRNLLGEPFQHYFDIEPDNIHYGKSILLGCTCGITECWFLVAQITLTATTVQWSRIGQFHRNCEYDLEFVFDRQQYESQLTNPSAE